MKNILPIFLLLTCGLCFGQNLVPNPSFEDTIFHNGYCYGEIEYSANWFNPNIASPDFYTYNPSSTNCTYSSFNNPSGYQLPRTGVGYVGIYCYAGFTREYAAVKLDSNLSDGCQYYIEFYVSRADKFNLASDKIGCAFTNDTAGYSSTGGALPLFPAIQSTPGVLIIDTINWVKISGTYTANGSERFLLIGNFYNNADTYFDTVTSSHNYGAYYYVDDVYLSIDSASSLGINAQKQTNNFTFYPNPFNNALTVLVKENEQTTVSLYNFLGQQVLQQSFTNSTTINTGQMPDGIYFFELKNSKETLKTGKVVKQ